MKQRDPNMLVVELVAAALGDLREELVLVGGCSVGLLITDKARPQVRQTIDVDLVAEATSLADYYTLSTRLGQCGFGQSADADHVCRWRKGALLIDVMPSDESALGHSSNRWFSQVVRDARPHVLNSGLVILLISPPLFLATKLDAFYGRADRAGGDYAHHDMEDIINVIDGRPEIAGEVTAAADDVREFLRSEFDDLLADESFADEVPKHLRPDSASQARVPIVIDRIRRLAGL